MATPLAHMHAFSHGIIQFTFSGTSISVIRYFFLLIPFTHSQHFFFDSLTLVSMAYSSNSFILAYFVCAFLCACNKQQQHHQFIILWNDESSPKRNLDAFFMIFFFIYIFSQNGTRENMRSTAKKSCAPSMSH